MTNITPTTPPPEGNIYTQVIGHVPVSYTHLTLPTNREV